MALELLLLALAVAAAAEEEGVDPAILLESIESMVELAVDDGVECVLE